MSKKQCKKDEKLRRVQHVAHWMIKGHSSTEIVKNISQQWEITERQAKNYIRFAYDFMYEDVVKKTKDSMAFHQKARLTRYQELQLSMAKIHKSSMSEKDKYSAILQIEKQLLELLKDMGKLDGLYVEKKELSGPGGEALQITGFVINEIAARNGSEFQKTRTKKKA